MAEALRIAQVSPYGLDRFGGVRSHIIGLGEALRERGHVVEVIAPGGDGQLGSLPVIGCGRAHPFGFGGTQIDIVWATSDAVRRVLDRGFDVLHLHTPWNPVLPLQLAARFRGARVGTFHDVAGTATPAWARALMPAASALLRFSVLDATIAVSPPVSAYLGRDTHEVIPNGIDARTAWDAVQPVPGPAAVLYLGRLEPRKDVDTLLRAMALLGAEAPPLWIAGEGPLRARLEARCRELGVRSVQFLGAVCEEDKWVRLQQAGCIVAPSRAGESFGIILLEAMVAGTIPIAADNPGYRHVLGGGGESLLFPPGDEKTLAARIRRATGDAAWSQEMQTWGTQRWPAFSWRSVAERVEATYRRAMERVRRRRHVPVATVAVSLLAVLLAGCVTAPAGQRRFYASRPYGTEQQFNPLTQIVNEGFDLLRSNDADRHIGRFPYGEVTRNLRSTFLNLGPAAKNYGWSRLVRNELLPLTLKSGGGGQWVPNYQFHLIGSGMVSARMTEWFEQHGASHPVAWSAVTMTASHVLNEISERAGPRSVDAATDLLIFDTAGFLLFRSDRVQRWFSEKVQLTNWPLQPSFALPSQTLENVGQQYTLRFRLPSTTRWRGMYQFGVSTLFGVSRDLGDARSLSIGLGADAVETPVVDSATDTRTVTLKPNAGVFFDRDGSLLASLLARDGYETIATLNVYPGAFGGHRLPLGIWVSTLRRGGVRFGVAAPWGLGIARSP